MPRLIDRYLIREIAPPFLISLLVFTFLLMLPPLVEVAEGLIAKGVPAPTIGWIMLTLMPQALGVTIPMAFLVGLLVALGRISVDREGVALQACGVSPARLLRPILCCAFIAAMGTLYTLVWLLPNANQSFREVTYSIIATRVQAEVKPRVFYEDFPGVILYVRETPVDSQSWSQVFLADTRTPGRPEIFVSERGRISLNREDRQVAIVLEDGARHDVTPDRPEQYEIHEFQRIVMTLDPETVFPRMGPQRGYPELTISELQNEVLKMQEAGLSPHRPIMEIHRKFSIPVACFIFGLIGLAFGLSNRRDRKISSFVVGIGVIFVYYVWMYVAEAAAKGSLVSPHLAMWLPNLALGLPALFFVWRRVFSVGDRLIPLSWGPGSTGRPLLQPSPATQTVGSKGEPRKTGTTFFSPLLPRLNLLDQYVLRHYFKIVALAFVGMLGIFYIATFIDLSDKLFKGETTPTTLLEYFWYATPQYVYYVLPISTLVATLVTIGLITRTSELVVMKACGIS
ncbi:MAG: LPS export ABC transporter permease LptF, partial [Acidobacteria bacterium]|nr:LPS export ABC transporter permease LptF [Acidobacteriota bacterium]